MNLCVDKIYLIQKNIPTLNEQLQKSLFSINEANKKIFTNGLPFYYEFSSRPQNQRILKQTMFNGHVYNHKLPWLFSFSPKRAFCFSNNPNSPVNKNQQDSEYNKEINSSEKYKSPFVEWLITAAAVLTGFFLGRLTSDADMEYIKVLEDMVYKNRKQNLQTNH